MKKYFFILLLSISPVCAREFNPPIPMVVIVDVADVRSEPIPHTGEYKFDPKQETQVIKGEPVLVYEKKGAWARIEATDQMEYTHNDRWQGYPGWVPWRALSKNLNNYSPLSKQSNKESIRTRLIEEAKKHLDSPYLWGGRSLYSEKAMDNQPKFLNTTLRGVDCSGLINWSFRQVGILIPRDAHEQFMKARPVLSSKMKKGDLVFFAKKENPKKIVHVAFYLDKENLLEAPNSGKKVRIISIKEKCGQEISSLKSGDQVKDMIVYFGTLLDEGN